MQKTDNINLDEFLTLPSMDIKTLSKFFKRKNWLTVGAPNPYRSNLREWVYQKDNTKAFFEYQDTKKNGQTWKTVMLDKPGQFEKLTRELNEKEVTLIKQDEDSHSHNWYYQNFSFDIVLKKFADMNGMEVLHLIIRKTAGNKI